MKILMATSRDELATKLSENLSRWGYLVQSTTSGIEALTQMQNPEKAPPIAIIDIALVHLSGDEIIRRLRMRVDAPYQYLILISESGGSEARLIGLSLGADAFLLGDISMVELRVQLQVGRRIMERQMRQRILQETLWNQANQDALTTLPNRRAILKNLERNSLSCAQRGQPLGLLMIDLDFFKQINDTYGHDGGDSVLREVAIRMRHGVRNTDLVGRFGGEEFLAVIPDCSGEELLRLAERIRSAVNKSPIKKENELIPVSCSIGVAVRWSESDGDPHETLQRADRALYVAKEMGRNRVVSSWSLHDRRKQMG